MKMKLALMISTIGLAAFALAGCQAFAGPRSAAAQPQVTPASATATATALPRPTLLPTPTATLPPDPAEGPSAAAQAYAAALEKGDFTSAAEQLSDFSLSFAGLTRGEAADQLAAAGSAAYTLRRAEMLDDTTALVGVRIQAGDGGETREETWVFRHENGRWLYNYGNLIDTRTLEADAQTTGGVTLKPRMLVRFSDRIRLELLAQNQTRDVVIFGQTNEILAAFNFGGETIEAEAGRILLEPLRSYPTVAIEVKGEFTSYPSAVDIRIWKNYQVDPWYSFDLTR